MKVVTETLRVNCSFNGINHLLDIYIPTHVCCKRDVSTSF